MNAIAIPFYLCRVILVVAPLTVVMGVVVCTFDNGTIGEMIYG